MIPRCEQSFGSPQASPHGRYGVALICVGLAGLGLGPAHGVARDGASCKRSAKLVVVDLDDVKHRHILDHVFDARRNGQPRILHIRREEARANRRASLRSIPTKPGFDRDEYPPAMSDEGGKGADVRYVRSAENRSAAPLCVTSLLCTATCSGSSSSWPNR
jgi:hypothetical protein